MHRACLFSLLSAFLVCPQLEGAQPQQPSQSEAAQQPTLSEPDAEVQRFVEKAYLKCGDVYLSKGGINKISYVEVEGMSATAKEGSALSEVDRANGVQWLGTISLQCQASRSQGSASSLAGWSQWSNGCQAALGADLAPLRLAKMGNQWLVSSGTGWMTPDQWLARYKPLEYQDWRADSMGTKKGAIDCALLNK